MLIKISLSIASDTVEIFNGVALINHPGDAGALFMLATLVLAIDGIGLIGARELLGAPRTGISGCMNSLRNQPEDGAGEPAAGWAAQVPPPTPPIPARLAGQDPTATQASAGTSARPHLYRQR